jgi:hypothetical protein
MKKLVIILLLFKYTNTTAQQSNKSTKTLLDSISYYLGKSENVNAFYFGYHQYGLTIDTSNLAIHFPEQDEMGPGKASGTYVQLSFFFNYLDPVRWKHDNNNSILELYIKGDDFEKYVAEEKRWDVGSYYLGRFKKTITSYYFYEIKFDKSILSPEKQMLISDWINQLKKD